MADPLSKYFKPIPRAMYKRLEALEARAAIKFQIPPAAEQRRDYQMTCTEFLVDLAASYDCGGMREFNPELANRLRTAACYTMQAEANERDAARRRANRMAVEQAMAAGSLSPARTGNRTRRKPPALPPYEP